MKIKREGREGRGERGGDKRRIFPSSQLEENRQRLDTARFLTNQPTNTLLLGGDSNDTTRRPWVLAYSDGMDRLGRRWRPLESGGSLQLGVSRARRRKKLHLVRVESAV